MSHAVTITRTTTTTSNTSYIVLNTGYLKTLPGLLKLAQFVSISGDNTQVIFMINTTSFQIIGAVCVGLVSWNFRRYYASYSSGSVELYFLLMAVTFLIGTFCLLLSCLISLSTGGIISKTIYELIYHSVAFVLYLVAAILLLVEVTDGKYSRSVKDNYMIASVSLNKIYFLF